MGVDYSGIAEAGRIQGEAISGLGKNVGSAITSYKALRDKDKNYGRLAKKAMNKNRYLLSQLGLDEEDLEDLSEKELVSLMRVNNLDPKATLTTLKDLGIFEEKERIKSEFKKPKGANLGDAKNLTDIVATDNFVERRNGKAYPGKNHPDSKLLNIKEEPLDPATDPYLQKYAQFEDEFNFVFPGYSTRSFDGFSVAND